MIRLPDIIDFDEAAHPGLTQVFHEIDAGIAAIIGSDPAFRPKRAVGRRGRPATRTVAPAARPRRARPAAAA